MHRQSGSAQVILDSRCVWPLQEFMPVLHGHMGSAATVLAKNASVRSGILFALTSA